MDRYLILNGPNLNLLGTRDPQIYGSESLADVDDSCRRWGAELGVQIETAQSNHEGALIDTLHDALGVYDGIVFNPGAYTHTSYALHDAIDAIGIPTVEVHISNVAEREEWRQRSVVRPACVATIYGRGTDGYRWAIRHLFHRREWPAETVRYADHADGVMDVRHPADDDRRVGVVLVHGGFWRHMWTRDSMDGLAVDLARRGFHTANVEYRRLGTGGGWPVTVSDVTQAIEHFRTTADLASLAVVGHSAGGHLALMAQAGATAPYLPVSLGGVLDMEHAVAEDVGNGAPLALMGGASPADASPIVHAAAAETVVVHGTADDRVPVAQARRYADVNDQCEYLELEGVGHFEFLERSDPAWMQVVDILQRRLQT